MTKLNETIINKIMMENGKAFSHLICTSHYFYPDMDSDVIVKAFDFVIKAFDFKTEKDANRLSYILSGLYIGIEDIYENSKIDLNSFIEELNSLIDITKPLDKTIWLKNLMSNLAKDSFSKAYNYVKNDYLSGI